MSSTAASTGPESRSVSARQPRRRHVALGLSLLTVSVVFSIGGQLLLLPIFGYPDVAGGNTGDLFRAFDDNRTLVMSVFYVITLVELGRIPVAIGVYQLMPRSGATLVLAVFGALGGVLRALDYILWTFLMPVLADTYLDPSATDATRDTATLMYEASFSYLGDGLGGNLGLLLLAVWAAGVSLQLLRARWAPTWLAVWGLFGAAGLFINYAEFLGSTEGFLGLGPYGQIAFYTWLGAFGLTMLWGLRGAPAPGSGRVEGGTL